MGTHGWAEVALESASVGVGVVSRGGRWLQANASLRRTLGLAADAPLVGLPVDPFAVEGTGLASSFRARLRSGAARAVPIRIRRADGSMVRVLVDAEPSRADDGRRVAVVTVREAPEDVPGPSPVGRGADPETPQGQKMEAVSRFAAGLAHEYNNALTAVAGEASALLGALPDPSPLRPHAQRVLEAAQRATSLTRRLVVFGAAEVGRSDPLDLSREVAAASEEVASAVRDVRVEWRLDAAAGTVRLDRRHLREILSSLLANAREAVREGGRVVVETVAVVAPDETDGFAFEPPVPPGRYASLCVGDDGVGMSRETRARIFDPFFTTKEEVGSSGRGLGLTTVYGHVARAHGHLCVVSAPAHGTALRLLFPCAEGECGGEEPAPGYPQADAPLTALVADDDEQVRYVIVRVLRQMGFEVLEAEDAVSARRLAQRHAGPIRILVTDVMMPRIHGTGLAAWMSAERPETSILLVSGFTDAPEIQRWVDDDPEVFLPKPFYPDELMERVRRRLAIA